MLIRLAQQRYALVRQLFTAIDHNLAISSILAGLTPGPVNVDHEKDPQLALTWTASRIFVAGNTEDEAILSALAHCIVHEFYPFCAKSGPAAFTLMYTPGLEVELQRSLSQQNLVSDIRHYYRLHARQFEREVNLPDGYTLMPVSRALLKDSCLTNRDHLLQEMRSERSSAEDFLEKSFGVCVVHDEAIVGWCTSEYNYQDRCEIGIHTDESHRRQGLAKACATTLINRARELGVNEIGWHCWGSNEASKATATSLGFELKHKERVLFGHTDPVENLAVNGYIALRDESAGKALRWFEKAKQIGELPGWAVPYLQAAEALCQVGVEDE